MPGSPANQVQARLGGAPVDASSVERSYLRCLRPSWDAGGLLVGFEAVRQNEETLKG